jgi:hypothetical protein
MQELMWDMMRADVFLIDYAGKVIRHLTALKKVLHFIKKYLHFIIPIRRNLKGALIGISSILKK